MKVVLCGVVLYEGGLEMERGEVVLYEWRCERSLIVN